MLCFRLLKMLTAWDISSELKYNLILITEGAKQ